MVDPRSSPLPGLGVEEQRVLGCLLEKEVTVPGSYPMSVNAVITACNQASSRDPVTDYDEATVHRALRSLKDKELVAVTWQDSGRRTLKYVQTVVARHGWEPDQRALLTVLLLRGPQAPGALKARTERLHPFADRTEVEQCLAAMAAASPPLVAEQPRRPREQDHRWVHLLADAAAQEEAAAPAGGVEVTADREQVIAAGGARRDDRVRTSYGAVAASYAEAFCGELTVEQQPLETWLLGRVVDHATGPGGGPVVEVGCGPGHVTAHLAAGGVEATGIDLTPEMVEQAHARFPDGHYEVGDLRQLMRPTSASGWAAVIAWYSLIHLAPSELPAAIASLTRPLAAGGWLVLALHGGHGVRPHTRWFEQEVDLDLVTHEPAEVVRVVEAAGLVDVEWYRRGPIAAQGETTERLYVLARRPSTVSG